MSMQDVDPRAEEIQRQRNILAGGSGEPRSKTFNVLAELFGDKNRLSQVDQQQAVANARQVEQDAARQKQVQFENTRQTGQDVLAEEQRAFGREFRTEGREDTRAQTARGNRRQDELDFQRQTDLDLKRGRDEQDDLDENVLKTATFLQMHAEQGTLDAEVFERAGQALETMGIPVEEYGPIFEQAMGDPSVLPAYIATLTKKTKSNASRVKASGKPIVLQRDGKQFTRTYFDDGHFEDTPLEGARLVSDLQKDVKAGQAGERLVIQGKKVDPEVRGSIKLAEKAEEKSVERLNDALPEARNAEVALMNSDRALDLIDEGIRSGSFANARQETSRFFADILGKDADSIPQTDEFFARMGLEVAEQIKSFGAGTGLSDADREFASKIVGGSIGLDEAAIRQLVLMRRKINTKRIKDYNRDRDALVGDNPRLQKLFPRLGAEAAQDDSAALLKKYGIE